MIRSRNRSHAAKMLVHEAAHVQRTEANVRGESYSRKALSDLCEHSKGLSRLQVLLASTQEAIVSKCEYDARISNLADCLFSQGKHAEALSLFGECLAIREKARGKDHPDTVVTLRSMASCLYSQGNYEEAKVLFEECRATLETSSGSGHPDNASTLSNMALCLFSQGKYHEALALN